MSIELPVLPGPILLLAHLVAVPRRLLRRGLRDHGAGFLLAVSLPVLYIFLVFLFLEAIILKGLRLRSFPMSWGADLPELKQTIPHAVPPFS